MGRRNDPAVPTEQFEVEAGSETTGAVQEQHRWAIATLPDIDVNAGYLDNSHVRFLPLFDASRSFSPRHACAVAPR
jgi:hypothetical protein